MKKFKVYGSYTITVMKEVWANNEDDAMDKADDKFGGIIEYVGNGYINEAQNMGWLQRFFLNLSPM